MRAFPEKFKALNASLFDSYKYERDICYLREAIYEWYIGTSEMKGRYEDPFDLEGFVKAKSPPSFEKMVKEVSKELEAQGWCVAVGRMNSALWIYPKGQPPKSLPEW